MGAKRILFPLEMRNGEKVHTLKELKEKFDIWKILEYADSGQLVRWLRDRGANDMVEKIESLDNASEEYARGICEAILGEVSEDDLKQIEEIKGQKEKAEKEAAEQLRIEEEKAEERKKQPPTVLVNSNGIYVVEGNRLRTLKLCRMYSSISRDFRDFDGVVQENKDVYYLKNLSADAFHPKIILCKIDTETGNEVQLCEMHPMDSLCGVRNHVLFYKTFDGICELNLDMMQKRLHKIKFQKPLLIGQNTAEIQPMRGTRGYPCINENGKHMYCLMVLDRFGYSERVVDIDLIEDMVSTLIVKGEQTVWASPRNWGKGENAFVVTEKIGGQNGYKERCIYYNMINNQMQQLPLLEKEMLYYDDRCMGVHNICCAREHIYWLAADSDSWCNSHWMDLWEYNIETHESIKRVHLKNIDLWTQFSYDGVGVHEIFVSGKYLYMNAFEHYASWRFSLDDWKLEKLVKDGSEYKYVVAEINS